MELYHHFFNLIFNISNDLCQDWDFRYLESYQYPDKIMNWAFSNTNINYVVFPLIVTFSTFKNDNTNRTPIVLSCPEN